MTKLEPSDRRYAPIEAGVKDLLRELAESSSHRIMRSMAQVHGGARVVAFRDGLRELRESLPKYEEKLIALHLDLGVAAADAIAGRVVEALEQCVPNIAKSIAATFRGSNRLIANRTAQMFGAEVGMYASGFPGRVLVAVERYLRRNPASAAANPSPSCEPVPVDHSEVGSGAMVNETATKWDLFISHASEDKGSFVAPLVRELQKEGLRVSYDEHTLKLGDSLSAEIDRGLAGSRFGVVVLSAAFFAKRWPQRELAGLVQQEVAGRSGILPIWHGVTYEEVRRFSVTLADKVAAKSSDGFAAVVREILRAIGEPVSPSMSGKEALKGPVADELFAHRLHANFQGQCSLKKGKSIEVQRFIGPNRPTGNGKLRILRMRDLDDDITYTSAVYSLTMSILPTDATFRVRVAGAINQDPDSIDFDIEMTDEEYAKFKTHAAPRLSPIVG